MAEIEVGKQCSVSSCKQLDFLPFVCNDCSAIFCLEHRSTTSHNCQGNPREKDKSNGKFLNEKSAAVECSFEGCNIRDLMPVKCIYCDREFCLRHRHQPDHSCPTHIEQQQSSTEASGSKVQIERKEKKGRGGARSSSRAAKVALMKMKLHALGESSTPQEERVYFSIILPAESTGESKPMFFSKHDLKNYHGQGLSYQPKLKLAARWTVGRIIDQISKMYKLKNENNRHSSKKLRLFEKFGKRQLSIGNSLDTEMNENTETLFNGSDLILEYVDAEM